LKEIPTPCASVFFFCIRIPKRKTALALETRALLWYSRKNGKGGGKVSRNVFEEENVRVLVTSLVGIKSEGEARALLEDLLTSKEILDIAQRMAVAKMLSEKEVYSRIAEKTGASTATISRVNRSYTYGKGGYSAALERIEKAGKK
jgi:TrpR-related protein YerC/YecD